MNRYLFSLALLCAATSASAQTSAPQGPKPPADVAKPMSVDEEVNKTRTEMADDDGDKDGKISQKEFLVRHTDAFNRMDLNKDGFLTPEEFVTYRRQLIESNKRQMENMQKNMQ